jgi:hypothetical protein
LTKVHCDMVNCKEQAIGWMPVIRGNEMVARVNFCINHKQDCIDEFHKSVFLDKFNTHNN